MVNTVTKEQFVNLLKFIAIFSNDHKLILTYSPDYIIEVYGRFIGIPSEIKDWVSMGGIHPVLNKRVVESYLNLWSPTFKV